MKKSFFLVFILLSCQQSTPKDTEDLSNVSLANLVKKANEIENNFQYDNSSLEEYENSINSMISVSEEIIEKYPTDSLSGKYYLKLSVLYSLKNQPEKSRKIGELYLKNCSECLAPSEKKTLLENLVLYHEEQRDTIAIKRIYKNLLSLPNLDREDSLGYVQRISNLQLSLEDFMEKTLNP